MSRPSAMMVALWLALLASMAASWLHLATLFGRFEAAGQEWIGAVAATAVDLGIIASLLAIGELRSTGRATTRAKWTVAGLVALSCLANAVHAQVYGRASAGLEWWLSLVVAAALPLIVLALTLLLDDLKRQPLAWRPMYSSQDKDAMVGEFGGWAPGNAVVMTSEDEALAIIRTGSGLSASQISRQLGGRPHHSRIKRLAAEHGWEWTGKAWQRQVEPAAGAV